MPNTRLIYCLLTSLDKVKAIQPCVARLIHQPEFMKSTSSRENILNLKQALLYCESLLATLYQRAYAHPIDEDKE